jgi:hypothetical protein
MQKASRFPPLPTPMGCRSALSCHSDTRAPACPADDQWFDALSVADPHSEAGRALNAELEGLMRDMPTIGEAPPVQQPGPHVPDPPLEFASKDFVYIPVPKQVRRHAPRRPMRQPRRTRSRPVCKHDARPDRLATMTPRPASLLRLRAASPPRRCPTRATGSRTCRAPRPTPSRST